MAAAATGTLGGRDGGRPGISRGPDGLGAPLTPLDMKLAASGISSEPGAGAAPAPLVLKRANLELKSFADGIEPLLK